MTVCVLSVTHKQTCSSYVSLSSHRRHLKTSKRRSVFNKLLVVGGKDDPDCCCININIYKRIASVFPY